MNDREQKSPSLDNRELERENKFLMFRENKDLTTIKESVEESDKKMTLVTKHNFRDIKDSTANSPAMVSPIRPLIRSMKEDEPETEEQKSPSDADLRPKPSLSMPNHSSQSKLTLQPHL